jgi:hypothetical protein
MKDETAKPRHSRASQTQSKPVKLRDSQESEQIMGGPLCGLLASPERSNLVKPSQTQSNLQKKP